MKQKIHKLFSDVPYRLIGVVTHQSIHQISWMLSKELGLNFNASESFVYSKKNKEEITFPTYVCEYSKDAVYMLVSNKSEKELLLKSVKSVDYMLKISGNISENVFSSQLKQIKLLNNIATAFEIEVEKLRKSEKILLA